MRNVDLKLKTKMINKDQIQEFKDIYFKEYGVELKPEEAMQKATGLFNLFKAFSKLNNKQLLDTVAPI
ncbi:hypothetical protein KBD45_06210 [Candidatus Dojkabacteria bacterium]|nr:hypothetical protein [Candidatus Dojkabacteria bacterium]